MMNDSVLRNNNINHERLLTTTIYNKSKQQKRFIYRNTMSCTLLIGPSLFFFAPSRHPAGGVPLPPFRLEENVPRRRQQQATVRTSVRTVLRFHTRAWSKIELCFSHAVSCADQWYHCLLTGDADQSFCQDNFERAR
jgi:hypothetical protein